MLFFPFSSINQIVENALDYCQRFKITFQISPFRATGLILHPNFLFPGSIEKAFGNELCETLAKMNLIISFRFSDVSIA